MKLLLALGLLPLSVFAGTSDDLTCPTKAESKQVAANPSSGWVSYTTKNAQSMDEISLSYGHPRFLAVSAPDDNKSLNKTDWRSTWKFSKRDDMWISCIYAGSTLTVTRQVSHEMTFCEVTSTTVKGVEKLKVHCK